MNINIAAGRYADLPVPDIALLHRDVYAILGALLAGPPSAPRMHDLAGLTVLPGAAPALDRCLHRLKQAARHGRPARVSREYADVFIGLGSGEVVPYASWYLGNRLMARPLVRMRSDLPALRICLQKNVYEFEDHAAAMCEAMAMILDTPTIPPHRRHQFFDTHLAPWMSRFFDDLRKAPSANFYRDVGHLGRQFMLLEMHSAPAPALPTFREE